MSPIIILFVIGDKIDKLYCIFCTDYAAEAGSADAQEGDQGISAIFSSATAMYGLIAAVGVALLVIVICMFSYYFCDMHLLVRF